jgi:hypothetical protein
MIKDYFLDSLFLSKVSILDILVAVLEHDF